MKHITVLFTVIFLLVAGFSYAQPPQAPEHPPMMPGPGMSGDLPMPMQGPMFGKKLGLSEEQLAKIADYRLDLQKKMLPLRSDLVARRNELKLLLTADKPDQKKINQTIQAISQIRAKMGQLRAEHLLKVKSVLTPDQQKKFNTMILSGKRKMMNRGKMGGMRHHPEHMPGHGKRMPH